MTWDQRAKTGVDAKHFQAALAAKSRGLDTCCQSTLYALRVIAAPSTTPWISVPCLTTTKWTTNGGLPGAVSNVNIPVQFGLTV